MWPSLFTGYSHCPWHNPTASREMTSAQGTFYLRNTETLFAVRKPVFQLNVRETEGQLSLDVCPFFPLYFQFSLFFLQFICTKHFHKKKERTQEERKGPVLYPKSYQKNSGTQRQIGKNSFYTQETWKGQEGFQVAAISSLVLILELTWIFSHVWFSLSTGMAEGKAVGGIMLGFTLSTLL